MRRLAAALAALPPASGLAAARTRPAEQATLQGRTDGVGALPNAAASTRRIGGSLLERSDAWAARPAHHMTLETMGRVSDSPAVSLTDVAGS